MSRLLARLLLAFALAAGSASVAGAQQQLPAQEEAAPSGTADGAPPAAEAPEAEAGAAQSAEDDGQGVEDGHAVAPDQNGYVQPEILTDPALLPFPARKMRELLLEAARSGDVEKLRPFIGGEDDRTLLSFGGLEDDPIDFLKSLSGDGDGLEVLAILQEILEAGFVRLEPDTENEIYVWPYFHAMQLEKLTPSQRVELYTIVTHGDFEDMLSFGAYNFYRAGITPQGRWRFFVAGD